MENSPQTKTTLIPKLRFKEFEGDWKENILGNIAKFNKGKSISKSDIVEDGNLECIRYGELYTHYKEIILNIKSKTNLNPKNLVLSKINDVIIPASGETQIDIATASCVIKDGVALGGDLNIIKTKENGIFLSYYLNSKRKIDIARLSQGISVVHLYSSQLKTLKLNLPQDIEQQKIATFLTSVDTKIQQLNKKKELLENYKKGVMQQLFSQQLRFKNDDGFDFSDWEVKKLKELCFKMQSGGTPKSTNKSYYDGEIPFLAISDMTKQGKYLKYTSRKVSQLGIDNSSSWLVPKNSLIYSMYASVGFISINQIEVATSQAVMNMIIKKTENIEYIFYYLEEFKKSIHKYIETGTQGNINAEIVKSILLPYPSLKEQQKIATFLSAIDTKITTIQTQIAKTQTFKKGLLQQMFV